MDPLKICSVEFDDRDPYRATFNVHLSRDMTDFERQALPPLFSGGGRILNPWPPAHFGSSLPLLCSLR
jgi:hypothetical protein